MTSASFTSSGTLSFDISAFVSISAYKNLSMQYLAYLFMHLPSVGAGGINQSGCLRVSVCLCVCESVFYRAAWNADAV